MPRRMRQRHERLPAPRPADPHVILDHRVAAGKVLLIAQPLKNPLGRVPLLDRSSPVRLEDRVDHRQQGAQFGLRDRHRPRVAARQREPAHLLHRLPAQTEYPRSLTTAAALQEYKPSNGGVDLHGKHPRPPAKGASLTNGRILLPPHQHQADAPLAWLVTALHRPGWVRWRRVELHDQYRVGLRCYGRAVDGHRAPTAWLCTPGRAQVFSRLDQCSYCINSDSFRSFVEILLSP